MLAKKYRLTTEVFRQHARQKASHVIRSTSFAIKSFPGKTAHPRFGIVVGKGVDARSSARNRIKRIVYDAIGRAISRLPAADYICIMQPASAKKTKEELQDELAEILNAQYKY